MRLRSLFVLTLLAASVASFAADPKVEELLGKMRDSYKAIKSAKFEVKSKLHREDKEFEATTNVLFKSPNKVSLELTPDDQEGDEHFTLYYRHDGKKMAAGEAKDKLQSREYSEDAFPEGMNLETIAFWDWDKQLNTAEDKNMHDSELKIVEDVEWDGKKWLTLEESAPKSEVFVRYYIDPKTNLIWRTEVKELDTMKAIDELWITKLETDVEIDDDEFKIDEAR
jgi:outer membrane lipoprotein-sorting protein